MNPFKDFSMTTNIAIGIGVSFLVPLAARMLSGAGKPLLKEGVKGGLYVYDRGRSMLAEARESLEDVSAEAKSELSQSKQLPAETKK